MDLDESEMTTYCTSCGEQVLEVHNFCTACGTPTTREEGNRNSQEEIEEELIKMYLSCGYGYAIILAFLAKYHGISISMSTFQRRLRTYGLKRYSDNVDDDHLKLLITEQLDGAEFGGCPVVLCTDPGSENCTMATMQVTLRSDCNDEYSKEKSHRFVESKRNQRIEAWWSFFRKSRTTWWINFFKDLADKGHFLAGNELHKECLWYCFSDLLRDDLKFVSVHWNTHYIRKSRFDTLQGQPDTMFFLPERSGHSDQLVEVPHDEIEALEQHVVRISQDNNDNEYYNYFRYIIELEGLSHPTSWKEGLELYLKLSNAD
eukprot:gene5843-6541_t